MGKHMMNIRIGQRPTLVFWLIIALMVLLAGVAVVRIQSLSIEVTGLVGTTYPATATATANRLKANVNEISRSMLSTLVMSDE